MQKILFLILFLLSFVAALPSLNTQQRTFKSDTKQRLIEYSPGKSVWVSEDFLDDLDRVHDRILGKPEFREKYSDIPDDILNVLLLDNLGPGYFDITLDHLEGSVLSKIDDGSSFSPPLLTEADEFVVEAISKVNPENIAETVRALSKDFKTRNQKSKEANRVPIWIKSKFDEIAQSFNRTNVKITLFQHSSTRQCSVIVEIPGIIDPESITVLGAHEDSISSRFNAEAEAPGADDDASGIACLLETFRVLLSLNYQPSKSLHLISFAAEEYGLLGSLEIAKSYKEKERNVLGMLQVEMNGYETDGSIVILRETNEKLAQTLMNLSKTYLTSYTTAKFSKCSYGCSDQYSFSRVGYAASAIAEAGPSDASLNPYIHTVKDSLEHSSSAQIANFARLALSFAMEMTK